MRFLRKLSECKRVTPDHKQGQYCLAASRMSVVSKLKETNFVICDPSLPAEKFLMVPSLPLVSSLRLRGVHDDSKGGQMGSSIPAAHFVFYLMRFHLLVSTKYSSFIQGPHFDSYF